jgi:hypothetical protein
MRAPGGANALDCRRGESSDLVFSSFNFTAERLPSEGIFKTRKF